MDFLWMITQFFSWVLYFFTWSVTLVLWALLACTFGVWWCQSLLLYLPNAGSDPKKRGLAHNGQNFISPAEHNLDFEDLYLTSSDGVKIHAWFIKQAAGKYRSCPTIVFFHGNAGNIGYRMPLLKTLYTALEANVMAVQYRGYGNSEGSPSEQGLTRDSQAAIDWLVAQSDIDLKKVFVYGQSLGGGVAIKVTHANQTRIAGVMVENTFTSIDDMVLELGQKSFSCHWASIRRVPELRVPILFLSGQKDELIPKEQMSALYDASRHSLLRRMFLVAEGSHNDTSHRGGLLYFRAMATFIGDALAANAQLE